MTSKDFKKLLQLYANSLFELSESLQSLAFSPDHYPTIRYNRGLQSAFELYWCNENPLADLMIVWLSYSNSPILLPNGASTLPIPASVKVKALALLQELNDKRELVALYRCGYIKDGIFTLASWLIPYPVGHKEGDGDGSGVYYTVTRDGTLGLSNTNDKKLYAALL